MSNADDAAEADNIEAIKERKKEELRSKAGQDDGGTDTNTNEPVHVESEAHLSELVDDNDVVLVDFYADWCGPCQMIEPTVASVAEETTATVAKVDVDENQSLAGQYQVQGVPTLLLFANGEPSDRLVGMQDGQTLFDLVEQYS